MGIEINNLHHAIKGKKLLRGIHATIDRPEVIAVVGPNGAGKSTLLNCLCGLFSVPGAIQLDGRDLSAYAAAELAKKRAILTQQLPLSFPFKAREVVGMSFALSTLSLQQQQAITEQCLTIMSAQHLAERNFLNLSGGEKQRVHLARVLAQLMLNQEQDQMRYLWLDEPTAPLDLKHQYQLFDFLSGLPQQNIVVLMVIHDLNQAASCCDRMWMISDGRLVADDKPASVITAENLKQHFDIQVGIELKQNTPFINRGLT